MCRSFFFVCSAVSKRKNYSYDIVVNTACIRYIIYGFSVLFCFAQKWQTRRKATGREQKKNVPQNIFAMNRVAESERERESASGKETVRWRVLEHACIYITHEICCGKCYYRGFFLSNIDGSLCSLSVLVGYCTMGTLYVCVSLFDRCLRKVRILCRLSIDVVVFRGQQKRAKNIMCVHVSKWQFEASKHFPFDVCVCAKR